MTLSIIKKRIPNVARVKISLFTRASPDQEAGDH